MNKNRNNDFEVLAANDILSYIKDEKSLNILNKLLDNGVFDTPTIIESLKSGEITVNLDKIKAGKSPGNVNVAELENELIKSIGFDDPSIPQNIKYAIYDNIDGLINLKEKSPKRFQKMVDSGLFELIKEGKVSANILKNVNANTFLSNRTLKEIRKIKNGEPFIKQLSSQNELLNISKYVSNGDVCEFNGKLYVNDNGSATEIKLSKEKFEELFPPLSSVAFKQGSLGDCWLVSTLDNFMDLPGGRTALYKLFEQNGDDIYIKFPNGKKPIKFKNGEVLDASGKQLKGYSSDIPLGIRMIEQAYDVHRYSSYDSDTNIVDISEDFFNIQKLMSNLEEGTQSEAAKEILGNDFEVVVSWGRNLNNKQKMKDFIIKYANEKNTLIFFSTRSDLGNDDVILSDKYDLAGNHAYSIKGYNEETGMVYITNPWHTSVVTEIPLYELMKYADDISFAHLTKKEV